MCHSKLELWSNLISSLEHSVGWTAVATNAMSIDRIQEIRSRPVSDVLETLEIIDKVEIKISDEERTRELLLVLSRHHRSQSKATRVSHELVMHAHTQLR